MADEPDDDVLELTDALPDDEQPSPDNEGDDEFHIELEGEEPETADTPLVKQLREQLRDRDRRLAASRKEPEKVEVGPRPKLADFDYDEDKHEAAVDEWYARREQNSAAEAAEERRKAEQARTGQKYADAYLRGKARIPAAEFEAAEKAVEAAFTTEQQQLLLRYASNSANAVLVLAKYPAKLESLAATEDAGDFILAVRAMESKMTVGTNKPKPPRPEMETIQRGSASLSPTSFDKKMDKAEADAARTGQRGAIQELRRQYPNEYKAYREKRK